MLYKEVKFKMLPELEKIERTDLLAKPDCMKYWLEEEEPTVEECIETLLEKFPEKKIYVKVKVDDPFRD